MVARAEPHRNAPRDGKSHGVPGQHGFRVRTLLLLAALASGAYLVKVLLAEPDYGRSPPRAAVVDGGRMEEFIENAFEKELIVRWVEDGAPESSWGEVAAIVDERCVTCHYTGASFEVLPLDRYEPAAQSARVRPLLEEKGERGRRE